MKALSLLMLLTLPVALAAQTGNDELVNIKELIPDIVLDLKYNTTDNFVTKFTGEPQKLYTTDECLVSRLAANRLVVVQDSLRKSGLGLKIFDAYRPRTVQWLMWETLPPEYQAYVADPASGSNHNRGAAVDLTLVDQATGQELDMGTPFDWFGQEADIGYTGFPPDILANRTLLRDIMEDLGGFRIYTAEWWHYDYTAAFGYALVDYQLK
jgi:zinc D-Ala-D-Ala dipeptidase